MTNTAISRRGLIKAGAATAAGLGATMMLGTEPATASAAVSWPLMANGFTTHIDFHERLHNSHPYSAFQVDGGLIANAFGDPLLAFGDFSSTNGLNFARLADVNLNEFQIYRTRYNFSDAGGPGGEFYQYIWNGTGYSKNGPFLWKATASSSPFTLPVDNAAKSSWTIRTHQGTFVGTMRELHHFNDGNGERQFWGTTFNESTVGFTMQQPVFSGISPWLIGNGAVGTITQYSCTIGFLRALDTGFRAFQVYWGTDTRAEFRDQHGQLKATEYFREGEAIHFDANQNTQDRFRWIAERDS
ncbi:hypothetical protein OHA72_42860 [Dactylosporangium sp. NBC_01737]|uniref:hypothetical protein n=1 Tax=Dactylosporangium sp. NBC_01737 TaxID=2975959 RepID=UPI002E0D9527|nr:hypothetical protein OHA72_42860 [Dactylosporangium sp. NBC_01737]